MGVESNVGRQFNHVTIVGVGKSGRRDINGRKIPRKYECVCKCGRVMLLALSALTGGNTKSCGCVQRTANGLSRMPEYKVWKEMLRRCSDPAHARYHEWGGRGITVCPEWQSFDTFLTEMGNRPGSGYSIERRDNNAGYSKANCYWASAIEQNNNKSSNRMLTFNGRTQTMMQWCRELDLSYYTVRSRVYILGWPDEKALSTPTKRGCEL